MTNDRVKTLFEAFDTNDSFRVSEPFGGGHINDTYRVIAEHGEYTLQRINTSVFTDPDGVMRNIDAVTSHLSRKLASEGLDPARGTLHVIKTRTRELYARIDGEAYRLFSFVGDAKTYKKSENTDTFRRAARGFGAFGRRLLDFHADTLAVTIPDFHNTPKRYHDLLAAVEADVCGRRAECAEEIEYFCENADFYSAVTDGLAIGTLPLRVTHNDTKLDNVLFDDETDEAICVIDLDTVMPGSILYDFGDALRVGMNPVREDEEGVRSLDCRIDMFRAFTDGYLSVLGDVLTDAELWLLHIAPRLMTVECAMRFLTDYLSGDTYFKTSRGRQNLDRARVGIALARSMEEKEPEMAKIVRELLGKQ